MARRRTKRAALPAGDPSATVTLALAALLVLVLSAAAYLPVRSADFVQDDHVAVEENPIVARGDLGEIFSTDYWAGTSGEDKNLYRPVTVLSFALVRQAAGGASALASHAANLALHVLASLALLLLARRLGAEPYASAGAALLFAVHPVHVEAVAGVVGRAEILATLFALLALWTWSFSGDWNAAPERYRPASPGRARAASWATAALVFVALGSKEIALAVLPLILACELLFRPIPAARRGRWVLERAAAAAPVLLAVELFLILRVRALEALVVLQRPHPVDNPLVALDGPERLLTALGLLTRYARLLVFPVPLSADYSGGVIPPESSPFSPRPLAGLLLLAGLVAVASLPLLRRFRQDRPHGVALASFTALLFLLPYLIVGNLFFQVGVILGERLAYLPSAAFCLALGVFLSHLAFRYPAFRQWSPAQRARYAGLIAVVLLAAFTLQTYSRASVWQNDRRVFASAAAVNPESPRAFFIVASLEADDLKGIPLGLEHPGAIEALRLYDRAIENYRAYVPAWMESGILLARMGRMEEALERFRETVRLSPSYASAHLNLGIALHRASRLDEAEVAVRRAIVHDRDNSTAWAELGNILAARERPREAIEAWRVAIALGRADLVERIEAVEAALPL